MLKFLRDEAGLTQAQAASLLDPHLMERTRWGSLAAVRTSISQFETNDRKVPHLFRVAFCAAYNFPIDWFTFPWKSEKAFAAELKRHRAARGAVRPPTLSQIAATFAGAAFVEALPQPNSDYYSQSRHPLFERFRTDLQSNRPGVLVVEGVSGYGKSSFVSLAIQQLLRMGQRQLILAVKCMDRSAEQIVNAITDLVRAADPRLNLEAPERIFQHVPTIIVLDDADKIAGPSELGGAPIAGARLADLFASAMQNRSNLKVVLTMRSSSGPAATLFEEISLLTGRSPIPPYHLDPLTTDDVAMVIRKKLQYENDASVHFAELIGGDPIAVSSFVAIGGEEERKGRTLPWLEMMASTFADRLPQLEERTTEMLPLLETLERRSDTALLTAAILAFSLGAVDLGRCQGLVDDLRMEGILPERPQEVANDTVRSVLNEVLDDFTIKADTHTELHSRVKTTFRALLADRMDEAVRRHIHRRMAQSALEPAVGVVEAQPTPLAFGSYVAILHHLIAIYHLAPVAKPGSIVIRPKAKANSPSISDALELELLLESDERILDRAEIANIAFAALMLTSVDPQHGTRIVSRQFGDYERKLKMLAMFTEEGLKEDSELVPLPELARPYTVQLLLDIAVCAAQSGLLEIASEAVRARNAHKQERAHDLLNTICSLLQTGTDDEDATLGSLIQEYNADSEHLNIHATTLSREGKIDAALDLVRQHASDAHDMAMVVRTRRMSVEHMRRRSRLPLSTLLVAGRRLLAKYSQLLILKGDMQEATKWFGLALHCDSLRHKTGSQVEQEPLDLFPEHSSALPGEPGRAYFCMLMHGKGDGGLEAMAAHIEASIAKKSDLRRLYEQIDWLVLRASLERLCGDGLAAARTLREAQRIRRQNGVNLSFASSIILSTEEERQRIRARASRGPTPRLRTLYKIASGAGHVLLACDVALLLAESASNPEERHEWTTTARRTVVQGYGFRSEDLARLEANGTFADLL